MTNKGTCQKHGEFILAEGCPQCIAERQTAFNNNVQPNIDTVEGLPIKVTTISLRPGEDIEARGYSEEASRLLDYAEARVITTVEDVKLANDDLICISKLKKAMEGKKKEYLAPLKAQTEAIITTYSILMAPIFQATSVTKDKMLVYNTEQERIRQEQEEINRKRQEAADAEMRLKGEITEPVNLVEVLPEAPKRVSTDMGTSGMVDHWKYEVVDLAIIPREYLLVDSAMLNAIAKKHHDQKQVPGVRFYNEPIIAVRAR